MKAVIFGVNGQDGFYLTQLLSQMGIKVIGISRNGDGLKINLSDFKQVSKLIETLKPEYIFHLAANSTTRHEALFENHETISTGTLNILEATKSYSPTSRIFISGSGLQFVNNNRPIMETDAFEARDAYSICRIQSVYAARYYRRLGIKTYVGYFFNHDSPLRSERHMTMKIAKSAKRIAAGSTEKLEIGDISVIKEYGFAGDIVKGIWQLVNQESVVEANIATGAGFSIQEWVEICFNMVGLDWLKHVVIKPGFVAEYEKLVADVTLIHSAGWYHEVEFKQLAEMMMK
ncbi:MAG: GDP-mannose 4,6-dehydratase [Chitinophagaceae bacterium]